MFRYKAWRKAINRCGLEISITYRICSSHMFFMPNFPKDKLKILKVIILMLHLHINVTLEEKTHISEEDSHTTQAPCTLKSSNQCFKQKAVPNAEVCTPKEQGIPHAISFDRF